MHKPTLPPELVTLLAPALAIIRDEVSHGVALTVGKKGDHIGRVVARANGQDSYGPGHEAVMQLAFGPALLAEIRAAGSQATRSYERTCECASCEVDNCHRDCDPCDDGDCDQCHPCDTYGCCGYCSNCETCHGDGDGHTRDVNGETYCRECDHTCET